MIEPPERLPERDAAIDAVLPVVPRLGWTLAALLEAAAPDADLLFADGADMVECWADLADRRMEAEANAMDIAGLRVSERVRAIVALRLEQVRPHRDALRRAMGLLARPSQAALAGRITARTVDTMWFAAGDTSVDASWYTKRAILASVYATTLLFFLQDDTGGLATLAFLDRRLAGVGRLTKLSRRVRAFATRR